MYNFYIKIFQFSLKKQKQKKINKITVLQIWNGECVQCNDEEREREQWTNL